MNYLLFCLFLFAEPAIDAGIFRTQDGVISFRSDASLENITAISRRMQGALNTEGQTFAWSVEINSFEGFNSPLQKEHFNENYMETDRYPQATFTGKIIEKIDFNANGVHEVRAKGKLNIHGVEQERIIPATLEIKGKRILVSARFKTPLTDHNITIPRVVHQKIAEEIEVQVHATLTQ